MELKYVSLLVLVLQNTAQVIVMKYSKVLHVTLLCSVRCIILKLSPYLYNIGGGNKQIRALFILNCCLPFGDFQTSGYWATSLFYLFIIIDLLYYLFFPSVYINLNTQSWIQRVFSNDG
jgi:hypothetical protein